MIIVLKSTVLWTSGGGRGVSPVPLKRKGRIPMVRIQPCQRKYSASARELGVMGVTGDGDADLG